MFVRPLAALACYLIVRALSLFRGRRAREEEEVGRAEGFGVRRVLSRENVPVAPEVEAVRGGAPRHAPGEVVGARAEPERRAERAEDEPLGPGVGPGGGL